MTEQLKRRLKDAGQNSTGPRLAVFKYLQSRGPSTISTVIAALTPGIDRASIYRSLALFRELGIVQDIVAGGRRMIELTDQYDTHHHHLSCLHCGAIKTIDDPAIERLLGQLAERNGFVPSGHQIEISGLCHKCYTKR
jgi:Fur family transcriptional regulator, ferric uptake regulator